jgi:single-strand DNA-binding protein
MAINLNRVTLTGNLTADPDLHAAEGSTPRCRLRVAVNGRKRTPENGWTEKANFFDVTVFGAQAENCATYLRRGRAVAVDGRLDWSSWVDGEGNPRQRVEVIAETVQFLGARPAAPAGADEAASPASPDAGAPEADAAPQPATGPVETDAEDIPF